MFPLQDPPSLHINSLFILTLFSVASITIGKSLRYFEYPNEKGFSSPKISLLQVLTAFIIYLATLFLGSSIIRSIAPSQTVLEILQMPLLITVVYLLCLFCKVQPNRSDMKAIFKSPLSTSSSWVQDIFAGFIGLAIAFPVVLFTGQLADLCTELFIGYHAYEQVAVHYLRMSTKMPFSFFIATFSIIIFAPLVEEFLFRGLLLNYLERYIKRTGALIFSSITFALFHFAPSQGIGNISLVSSLFVFSLFLGHIYKRRRSLISSITLHMTFNTINVIRILTEL